jgi:hypothetical protein
MGASDLDLRVGHNFVDANALAPEKVRGLGVEKSPVHKTRDLLASNLKENSQ